MYVIIITQIKPGTMNDGQFVANWDIESEVVCASWEGADHEALC